MENNDYVVRTVHSEIRVIPCRAHDRNGIRYMNASDTIIGVIRIVDGVACVVLRTPNLSPVVFLERGIGSEPIPYHRIVEAERVANATH